MSEVKYTPGPWEMNLGVDGAVVYHPDQGTIADIPMDLSAYPHNARLIAAAPELLEALEALVEYSEAYVVEWDQLGSDRMAAARATIAKAKGTL